MATKKTSNERTETSSPIAAVHNDSRTASCDATTSCDETCIYKKATLWLLVIAQFVVAALMVSFLSSPMQNPFAAFLCLAGIALGIWAIHSMKLDNLSIFPTVRQGARLVRHGPYRRIRHPMYSALLMFCGAYAISDFSAYGLQLWVAMLATLITKIGYEEPMLRARFAEYHDYAKHTGRLIPRVF